MRELLGWLTAVVVIGLGWVGLYEMAAFATPIPADEPPGAFGVDPMYLLALAFPLALLSGSWLLAATIRGLIVVAWACRRRPAPAKGMAYPLATPSERKTP